MENDKVLRPRLTTAAPLLAMALRTLDMSGADALRVGSRAIPAARNAAIALSSAARSIRGAADLLLKTSIIREPASSPLLGR